MKSPFRFLLLLVLTLVVLGFWNSSTPVTHANPIIISGSVDVASAQVSPDQRYVVYSTIEPLQIFSYDLQTGTTITLTNEIYFVDGSIISITSNSEYVIYSHGYDNYFQIFRVPIDGGESTLITYNNEEDFRLTADSQYIVFSENDGIYNNLYSASIMDGTRIPLSNTLPDGDIYRYEISPSGRFITYAKEFNDRVLRVLMPVAGGTQQVINPEGTRAGSDTALFVESENALFFSTAGSIESRLYRIALTGGVAIPVTPLGQVLNSELLLTYDGRSVLYFLTEPATVRTLHRLSLADNSSVAVAAYNNEGYPSLILAANAPIAFTTESIYSESSYTTTLSSVRYDPIAPKINLATINAISLTLLPTPNGDTLVYGISRANNEGSLHSIPTDGSAPAVDIATGGLDNDIRLSPTYQEVFFRTRTSEGAAYFKAPIGGGTVTTFLEVEGMFSSIGNVGFLDNGSVILLNYENDDIALQSLHLFENAYVPAPPTTPTPTPTVTPSATPILPTTKFHIYLPLTER